MDRKTPQDTAPSVVSDVPGSIKDSHNSDASYLAWKEWGSTAFGEYTSWHAAYYKGEIKKAAVSDIHDVLEIGFGHGMFLSFAKKNSLRPIGIELNKELLAISRQAGYETYSSLDDVPSEDSFDLILALNVLEHIPQEVLPSFLVQIKNRLNQGGAFIATFPNGDSPFSMFHQNGDTTHVSVIGSQKIRFLAQTTGLEIIYCGAPTLPIFGAGLKKGFYGLLAKPLRKAVSIFLGLLFLQRTDIPFDADLSVIFKKLEER